MNDHFSINREYRNSHLAPDCRRTGDSNVKGRSGTIYGGSEIGTSVV